MQSFSFQGSMLLLRGSILMMCGHFTWHVYPHLLFIQENETHYNYVYIASYSAIFE